MSLCCTLLSSIYWVYSIIRAITLLSGDSCLLYILLALEYLNKVATLKITQVSEQIGTLLHRMKNPCEPAKNRRRRLIFFNLDSLRPKLFFFPDGLELGLKV